MTIVLSDLKFLNPELLNHEPYCPVCKTHYSYLVISCLCSYDFWTWGKIEQGKLMEYKLQNFLMSLNE